MQRIVSVFKSALICVALAGVASWLTVLLWPFSERFPFAFFLAAVVVSAWICGPAAAVFTTGLCTSALATIYHWQSPTNGFEIVQDNLPRLGLFLFTGMLTSYLVRECRGAISAVDRVHLMLGHLGEALVTTDPQGMVRYINQEAQILTGYEARDALGKPLGHVLALHDEQTRQPITQPTQAVLTRRVSVDLPPGAMLQSARGKSVAIEGRAAPILEGDQVDGMAITFRDVTKRRSEELVDRRQLERWQRAVAALPDPIFIKDELGNYVGGNAAAGELVAREPQAIAGAEDAALFSQDVARTIIQADRVAFETGKPQTYQLAVGEGETSRVFEAVKTPIFGSDGKLAGLVDVLHEATAKALNEEKHKKVQRELERRLEEQAAAHKSTEQRLRESHEKECIALQDARQNVEASLNEQLAELRHRLDEKTIEHAEAQALLEELTQKHADELGGHVAAERQAASLALQAELDRLKAEHAGHVQGELKKEQQRAEGLMHLTQHEHALALEEYHSVWALTEDALQQARKELEEHKVKAADAVDAAAVKLEREEMIQRLSEQTAAKLGLEESLRRAHERIEELELLAELPAQPDDKHVEEIRRQAASEHEQKWNEAQLLWQHRLVQVSDDHDARFEKAQENWEKLQAEYEQELADARNRHQTVEDSSRQFASAQENWLKLQADYERQLAEARNRHHDELAQLQEQLAQSRGLDPRQAEEIRLQAHAEQERKWQQERLAWQQQVDQAWAEHKRQLEKQTADYERRLEDERARWQQQLDLVNSQLAQHGNEQAQKWAAERAQWQHRLDLANQEHNERYRSADENWQQKYGEFERRLNDALARAAQFDQLRNQLDETRLSSQQLRHENDRLMELLNRRPAPAKNGKSSNGKLAYETWDGQAEPVSGDWLSFN